MPEISVAKIIDEMPEAFVSDTAISREVSRAVKAGKLRKLASRLYTRNLTDQPEDDKDISPALATEEISVQEGEREC